MDPGYLIGGTLTTTGVNGAWGSGEWLVVEADESDRSFLELDVDIAVVTNVELDHHTEYGSRHELDEAYARFLAKAPRAVLPEDDAEIRALVSQRGQTPLVHGEASETAFSGLVSQRGLTPLVHGEGSETAFSGLVSQRGLTPLVQGEGPETVF